MKVPTSELMSFFGILTGISSLIFTGFTWQMTNELKEKDHTHNEMSVLNSSIIDLSHQRSVMKTTLKRLDTDIQTLFDDLGEANKRVKDQKAYTVKLEKLMAVNRDRTKSKIRKTYEKIENNTKAIEDLDLNFNSRIIGLKNKMNNKIDHIRRYMESHHHKRNVSDT